MKHWLLLYDYADDYLERRGEVRPLHFAHAREFVERGELLVAGAFAEPADGAVLAFATDDESVVESFAANDPYVKNGLVTSWRVRRWVMVIGEGAEPT
jgi:uncharacterized protein YciI